MNNRIATVLQQGLREALGEKRETSTIKIRGSKDESRGKRKERREKMAASSIDCIFTGSRGYLEKVLKIRGGHRNGRQLESLYFYRVTWPPR